MRIAILAAAAAMVGCAGVTDVVSTGPDTYLVASHGTLGWSSGGAQKAAAIQKANDYCSGQGKMMQLVSATETNRGGYGQIASGEAEFRCIAR